MADAPKVETTTLTRSVALGKDLVSLLRDFAIFVLALLLLVFPGQFNSILVNAGFEEGSLVGFKWKSKLVESDNALKEAQSTIAVLQASNDELVKALAEDERQAEGPGAHAAGRATAERKQPAQGRDRAGRGRHFECDRVEQPPRGPSGGGGRQPVRGVAFAVRLLRRRPDARVHRRRAARPERAAARRRHGLDAQSWSYPAGERPGWLRPAPRWSTTRTRHSRRRRNWLAR